MEDSQTNLREVSRRDVRAPARTTVGTDRPRAEERRFDAPAMDVPRSKRSKNKKKVKLAVFAVLGVAALALITFGLAKLKPAAMTVEAGTIYKGTVERGPLVRQVHGTGTLVPENIRVIAAAQQGLVERVLVQPGTEVSAGTVLVELSNPELQQATVDTEYQMHAAEAEMNNIKAKLDSDRLSQQAVTANVHAEYEQAKLQADTDAQLAKEGLIPALNLKLSKSRADELANRFAIEQKRLDGTKNTAAAQVASQQARISQLKALLDLKHTQVATLRVVAGTNGVLRDMQVKEGQQVTPGTELARVVEPQHLKAELHVAETQMTGINMGQPASVDTRNGIIPGHVSRIDPAAQNGTITVDVALDGELPPNARPDISVDGTIDLERIANTLYVGRPAFGQPNQTVKMFKLSADGKTAERVTVKLGRASVSNIEIVDGLKEGDTVVLSDTSAWDNYDTVRLN